MPNYSAQKPFWVTNISNRNVSLSDLGLTIPAGKTMNLLNTERYAFGITELIKSATSGSLFKKRDKIVVRKVPPTIEEKKIVEMDFNAAVPSRRRSVVEPVEVYHEELEISDESFAEQAAELLDNYKG